MQWLKAIFKGLGSVADLVLWVLKRRKEKEPQRRREEADKAIAEHDEEKVNSILDRHL